VHLGDVQAGADLDLREVVVEAQAQDGPFAVGEDRRHGVDADGVVDASEAVLGHADRLTERRGVVIAGTGRVLERYAVVGACGEPRLDDLLDGDAGAVGDLPARRRSSEFAFELVARALDVERALLQFAWDSDEPALVAEVALQFAGDGRDREGRERDLAGGVEAVDRVQQPDRGDLDEVVAEVTVAVIASREMTRQREKAATSSSRAALSPSR
jgi:hypothetical protein